MKRTITIFMALSVLVGFSQSEKVKIDSIQYSDDGSLLETCYFKYNVNNEIVEDISLTIDGDTNYRTTVSYNTSNRISEIINEFNNPFSDELQFVEMTSFEYDLSGNETKLTTYFWDQGEMVWDLSSELYSYYDNNSLTTDSLFARIGDVWELSQACTYLFNEDGNVILKTLSGSESIFSGDEQDYEYRYVYDVNKKLKSVETYYVLGSEKLKFALEEYVNPIADSLVISYYDYDLATESYVINSRTLQKLDENGAIIELKEEVLNESGGEFVITDLISTQYSESLELKDFVGNKYFEIENTKFLPVLSVFKEDYDSNLGGFETVGEEAYFYSDPTINSITKMASNKKVFAFPNPAIDQVFLATEGFVGSKIHILNSKGVLISHQFVSSSQTVLNLENYDNGVYTFIINGRNEVTNGKFTKQ